MKLKKRTLSLLILTLIVGLVFSGCQAENAAGSTGSGAKIDENTIAVVNGDPISLETFNKSFALVEKNYNELYGETIWTTEVEGKTVKQLIKEEILTNLIRESLIVNYVKDTGFKVDTADIDEAYKNFEEALSASEEDKAFYTEKGLDEAYIKGEIEAQLLNEEFIRLVGDEVKVDETKLNDLYETYTVQVSASHILVDNIDTANEIKTKLDAGEDFAALAKEFSKDPGSAVNGGSLGYFPRNVMVPEFEQVAFNTEVGQVSDIVESKFGFHIIKVDDKLTVNDMIKQGSTESEVEIYKSSIVENMTKDAYFTKVTKLNDEAEIVQNDDLLNKQ